MHWKKPVFPSSESFNAEQADSSAVSAIAAIRRFAVWLMETFLMTAQWVAPIVVMLANDWSYPLLQLTLVPQIGIIDKLR